MGDFYNMSRANTGTQLPGYSSYAWIAAIDWLSLIARPWPLDAVDIDGEHVFHAGLDFIQCYALPKSIEIPAESNGEAGAENIVWKINMFLPGDSANAQQMIETLALEPILVHVQDIDPRISYKWQFGNERVPARIESYKYTSGNIYDGRKGWELVIIATERYKYTPGDMALNDYVLRPYFEPDYIN